MFFNKNKKYRSGIEKCSCNNNAEQCDLVFELKKLQEEANQKKALIEYYKNHKRDSVINVLKFIQSLEDRANNKYGVSYSKNEYYCARHESAVIEEICYYSTREIEELCDSIKSVKVYTSNVTDVEKELNSINDGIQNVKNKLGIE